MNGTHAFVVAARLVIAFGVIAGLWAGALRFRAEHANRSVALAVDYLEVERLATGLGVTPHEVLQRFAGTGVTAAAVSEETLEDLVDRGLASVAGTPRFATVRLADRHVLERVALAWRLRGVLEVSDFKPQDGPYVLLWCPEQQGATLVFRGSISALRLLGCGLPETALAGVRQAGLEPVARIGNFPGASQTRIQAVLEDLRGHGIQLVVFSGTEVFGYYGQHREAAEAFRRAGVWYGQVEFGRQKGDGPLARALRGRYVRVHSISEGEMGTLSESEAVERFVRAARERNIRLCYVRLLTLAGEDALGSNSRYLYSIRSGIQRGSLFRVGHWRGFADPGVPAAIRLMVGLAVGTLVVFVVIAVWPVRGTALVVLGVLLVGMCAVLAVGGDMGRKVVALLAALAAPSLAMLRILRVGDGVCGVGSAAGGSGLRQAVFSLWRAACVTALGIVSVVAILASLPFMMKADQFAGIKLAHAVPMLLTAAVLVVGLAGSHETAAGARERWRRRFAEFMRQPVLAGALIVGAVLLMAILLAVVRTGNDPGVGVSGLELKFRALLDALLPARPRTKEFLIGHPALMLGVFLALRGYRRVAAPLLILGALGQASLLNTFCHIHTPLFISATRAVVGLVLGTLLGVALCLIAGRWAPAHPQQPGADT